MKFQAGYSILAWNSIVGETVKVSDSDFWFPLVSPFLEIRGIISTAPSRLKRMQLKFIVSDQLPHAFEEFFTAFTSLAYLMIIHPWIFIGYWI
jgi:hypothetical protein